MKPPLFSRVVRGTTPFLVSVLTLATVATAAETKSFELNPDRIKVVDPKGLAAQTYFVPGVNLVISCSGSVWAQSKKGGANAQAHGKFYVQGLDKSLVQELARKVQDDFVAKLRATGATVLTYDDLKSDPLVAGHGRRTADAKWNLPTRSKDPLTYIIATPTDAQAFEPGLAASAAFWLHAMAKEKKLIVLLPEITFTVPQMWGEVDAGYQRDSAGIAVIATGRPVHHAALTPISTAATIRLRLCMSGRKNVASTASSMPTPAHTMPPRAVRGELMRFSPRMNSSAARK